MRAETVATVALTVLLIAASTPLPAPAAAGSDGDTTFGEYVESDTV